jgi:hypothetical protein
MNLFYSLRFLLLILLCWKYGRCLLIQVSLNFAIDLNLIINLLHELLSLLLLLLTSNEKFMFRKGLLRLCLVTNEDQIGQHLVGALDFSLQVLRFHPSSQDDSIFFLIYFILVYIHLHLCLYPFQLSLELLLPFLIYFHVLLLLALRLNVPIHFQLKFLVI